MSYHQITRRRQVGARRQNRLLAKHPYATWCGEFSSPSLLLICVIPLEYVCHLHILFPFYPAVLSPSDGQDLIQPRMDSERNVGRLITIDLRRPLTRIL